MALTRKPEKGDRLIYERQFIGTVVRVEGNLCWFTDIRSGVTDPFIWFFPRDQQLNQTFSIEGEPGPFADVLPMRRKAQ